MVAVSVFNKQPAVFLMNYLVDNGLKATFVKNLVDRAICQDLLHGMAVCQWDKATMTITTLEDKATEKLQML